MEEQVNEWYSEFGSWQSKVFETPEFGTWRDREKDALDEWILTKCLPKQGTTERAGEGAGVGEGAVLEELEAMRWRLFPKLNPSQVG